MSQRLDPNSDVSIGLWTTAPLWSKVDDGASPSDGDFIQAVTELTVCELTLTNPSSTPGSCISTVTIRAKYTGLLDTAELNGYLIQGITVVGSGVISPSSTFSNFTFNSTSTITDFNDLSVRLELVEFNNTNIQVSWIKVDVPDQDSDSNCIFFAGD